LEVCTCNAGWSGPDGGPCTACVAGKYKSASGSSGCEDCPADSSSPAQSSTALAECTCNAGGSGPDGGPCTACVAGKYKSAGGTADCTDCTPNSNSPSQSSARALCSCNAGYSGDAGTGTCTACVAGKYKSATGTVACTDCVAGKYGVATGQSAEASCTICTANSNSPPQSSARVNPKPFFFCLLGLPEEEMFRDHETRQPGGEFEITTGSVQGKDHERCRSLFHQPLVCWRITGSGCTKY
jgi:hypothetical protein